MSESFLEDLNRQRQRQRQFGFQKREICNMLPFFKVFHEAQLLTKSSSICPKEGQNLEDEERKDQETKTGLLRPIKTFIQYPSSQESRYGTIKFCSFHDVILVFRPPKI